MALGACTSTGGAREPSSPVRPAARAPAAGGQAFTGSGVRFSYPAGWRRLELTGTSAQTLRPDWSQTVGIDARNLVTVSGFTLDTPITGADLGEREAQIRAALASLFTQAGGALRSGPAPARLAGLPALAFTGTARDPSGRPVRSRLILAFDGTTEYFVNCQYDDRARERILRGCERIVSTFSTTG